MLENLDKLNAIDFNEYVQIFTKEYFLTAYVCGDIDKEKFLPLFKNLLAP